MNKLQSDLRSLLKNIANQAGSNFSGVGLIIYDSIESIPIVSLRESSPKSSGNLTDMLARISSDDSDYHDGFHLINKNWELTHVSQYFSPPILRGVSINRSRNIGGRYVAAQYGSGVGGVILSGIASNGFGMAIFKDCEEILFEGPA